MEALEPRQMMAIAPIEGTPFWDHPGNYIPPSHTRMGTEGYLAGTASGDPLSIGVNYLRQNAAEYGLTTVDLTPGHYYVTRQYTDADSGISHIYLQQRFNDLPVEGAYANVHVDRQGRVIAASANFAASVPYPIIISAPSTDIGAQEAVSAYAAGAGLSYDGYLDVISDEVGHSRETTFADPDLSADPIPAKLHYVPTPHGLQLAWRITARAPDSSYWFDVSVSATGSEAGQVVRAVDWVQDASYNVFPLPLKDPGEGNPAVVIDPQNLGASPFGWHDTNGFPGPEFTDTRGNNVDVMGPGTPPIRANGGPTLDFLNPIGLPPNGFASHTLFSTQQLFYTVNVAHDVTFHHGFDEASGNFQTRNYSGQGQGFDEVLAFTQTSPFPPPGPVQNNAFMATPPDGLSPFLVMGVATTFNPSRDITLDNVVILHEFFHGVSNRLVGGPDDLGSLSACQSRGMGEGWSDWFGILMTLKPTENKHTPQIAGEWAFGPGGVRRFPYSFSKSINPLTLGRYNDNTPLFPGGTAALIPCLSEGTEVHNSGEIWAQTLLDMTWLLIEKHGFSNDLYTGTGGQNVALDLVLQGLKLSRANPTFLEARDAIIAADFALYGGQNFNEIWTAFARRGFGKSANAGANHPQLGNAANSFIVAEAFDQPAGPATISGTVFDDADGDATRDASEASLAGWTVYIDSNNNGQLDSTERRTQTAADGSYSILDFASGQHQVVLRQVVMPGWKQTLPTNNAARTLTVQRGANITGQNFAAQQLKGEVRGFKWNDTNANGVRDAGELGLEGVYIYVDVNNDGHLGVLEPAGITDRFGNYAIKNVSPGSYTVREIAQPGMTQTFPDPLGVSGGAHQNVLVVSGQITFNINFGNTALLDFGDAPDSYGTTLTAGGPRHGLLVGFRLGSLIDTEGNGQPSSNASGDDASGVADEEGVQFLSGLTPGTTATVRVTVNDGGFSPGKLHGWVDFNRDGDFDSGERVIANRFLPTGVYNITFAVPSNAPLGSTFARFRYGYENDLGPLGPSVAGEVEDYPTAVLSDIPIASPDDFPRPGEPPIKQGSIDNVLDVLANDFGTSFGPVDIANFSFPNQLPSGATLELAFDSTLGRNVLLYTPGSGSGCGPNRVDADRFTYQVTDGRSISAPGQVSVCVSVADPKALDDSVNVQFTPAPGLPPQVNIPVMVNDVFPSVAEVGETKIVPGSVRKVNPVTTNPPTPPVTGDSIAIAPDERSLNFTPPPNGFRGTVIYEYTIDDADPTTLPSTARVTVQVVTFVAGEPQPLSPDDPSGRGHQAQFVVEIVDANTGAPLNVISADSTFLVRVSSQDLRTGGDDTNRGMETAYLDLLFDRNFVEPVLNEGNPRGFVILYGFQYNFAQRGTANSPAQGAINEVGASHDSTASGGPVGQGLVNVFEVLMRAKAPTAPGQTLQVFADPADPTSTGNEFSQIFLANNTAGDPTPIAVADERVFLDPSPRFTIVQTGQAEFTNTSNPLDVNVDGAVSAIDSLVVINDLNRHGTRQLTPLDFFVDGRPVITNRLDVNLDTYVSAIDVLLVFNRLNSMSGPSSGPGLAGEGESAAPPLTAEGEGPAADGDSTLDSALSLMLSERQASHARRPDRTGGGRVRINERTSSTAASAAHMLASSALPATPASAESTDSARRERSERVNEVAADELFALIGESCRDAE